MNIHALRQEIDQAVALADAHYLERFEQIDRALEAADRSAVNAAKITAAELKRDDQARAELDASRERLAERVAILENR